MHISLDSALGRQRRLNSVGESVLQIAPSAAAAYSLRSLTGGDPKVVRVRRSALSGADNEIDFTVSEVSSGALTSFVTEPVSTLLNSAYYFSPDSHSHVDFDSDITLADGETMSLQYFFDGVTGTDLLFDSGGASANSMLITTSIAPRVRINSESIDFGVGCKLLINQLDTLTIARSGNDITITTGTGAVTKSFTSGAFTFNRLGGNSSQTFQGVFYNLQIGSRHNYTGLGGAATAWNDTVGSNNGTPDNLVSFTGQTVHGFVETWYDQSGNSRDSINTTAAQQPIIVEAGVFQDGLKFTHTDTTNGKRLFVPLTAANLGIFTFVYVGKVTESDTSYNNLLGGTRGVQGYAAGTAGISIKSSDGTISFINEQDSSTRVVSTSSTTATLNEDFVAFATYEDAGAGPELTFQVDAGNQLFSFGSGYVTTSTKDIGIMNATAGTTSGYRTQESPTGICREVLVYSSHQGDNRAALVDNINSQYNLF